MSPTIPPAYYRPSETPSTPRRVHNGHLSAPNSESRPTTPTPSPSRAGRPLPSTPSGRPLPPLPGAWPSSASPASRLQHSNSSPGDLPQRQNAIRAHPLYTPPTYRTYRPDTGNRLAVPTPPSNRSSVSSISSIGSTPSVATVRSPRPKSPAFSIRTITPRPKSPASSVRTVTPSRNPLSIFETPVPPTAQECIVSVHSHLQSQFFAYLEHTLITALSAFLTTHQHILSGTMVKAVLKDWLDANKVHIPGHKAPHLLPAPKDFSFPLRHQIKILKASWRELSAHFKAEGLDPVKAFNEFIEIHKHFGGHNYCTPDWLVVGLFRTSERFLRCVGEKYYDVEKLRGLWLRVATVIYKAEKDREELAKLGGFSKSPGGPNPAIPSIVVSAGSTPRPSMESGVQRVALETNRPVFMRREAKKMGTIREDKPPVVLQRMYLDHEWPIRLPSKEHRFELVDDGAEAVKAGLAKQKVELELLRELGVLNPTEAFGGNVALHHIEDRRKVEKRESWMEAMDEW